MFLGLRLINILFIPILLGVLSALSNHDKWITAEFTNSKVLLATAHPDDECMFFGPAVLSLRARNVDVYGLVFSNGNADGIGQIRERELFESFEVLGVARDRVTLLNHPLLQDNITQKWPSDLISSIISDRVMRFGITDVITFDTHGVSKHPNHISVCEGALRFKASFQPLPQQAAISTATHNRPRLWTLESVSISRKYSSVFGALATKLDFAIAGLFSQKPKTPALPIISTPSQYWTAVRAMKKHWSQLVWFRWLYIATSRYMWVNDLVEMIVTAPDPSSKW